MKISTYWLPMRSEKHGPANGDGRMAAKREGIMRTAIIAAGILALTITTAGAAENDNSANNWLQHCKNVLNYFDQANGRLTSPLSAGMCLGRVDGITSMLRLGSVGGSIFCADIPSGVTPEQILRVVVRHIDAKPQHMHEEFNWLAMLAIENAWPCKVL